jgi:transposase
MIDRSISKPYRWKVKSRLAVLEYVNVHGLKPAATRFGLDRKTIREWRTRAREAGPAGLVPRYPERRARRIPTEVVDLIAHARRDLQYGACRTRIWLLRVHQVRVAAKTITRICDDLGLPPVQRPKRRRGGRQLKLFEKATPGESVQVDVKVVKIGNTKAYQYTACDDCTRLRVLRLYRRQNTFTSVDFLTQIVAAFPFPIRKLQTACYERFVNPVSHRVPAPLGGPIE